MRSLKLLVTAAVFLAYFIGMIGLSALATGGVHSMLSPRSVPMAIVTG